MKTNRLIQEKSPYLLQHAYNPVDWYPWGDQAFEVAQRQDKPVLLSIGYSTCHWCHVMEHESFESEDMAKLMNEFYVSIKVDREERPDLDAIYMKSVQAMTGQGGWPLTVFLTPDRKPFFGGTYFPPHEKWGTPGFADLLQSIAYAWQHQRAQILTSSEKVTLLLAEKVTSNPDANALTVDDVHQTAKRFTESFDEAYGGFSGAPKFPMGHVLSYLLALEDDQKDEALQEAVLITLKKMADGGINDHLGGGFHRYSTDPYWQLPHFEKMLYDQALLVIVYLEAYQLTQDQEYADVAWSICDYVLRDMQDAQGGFYSAEDADSLVSTDSDEKKEGAFFVWSRSEWRTLLTEDEFNVATKYFGVLATGNAKQDPHGEFAGLNILYRAQSLEKIAADLSLNDDEAQTLLQTVKEKLYHARAKRPKPHLDDKVLTDWNGLMIAALSMASRVLDEPRYAEAARRAADFLIKHMLEDGQLYHRYRDEDRAVMGTLDDYAFLIYGLQYLYEATFDGQYLITAHDLTKEMVKRFLNESGDAFFLTQPEQTDLLYRPIELYDGAIPSGNAMAIRALVRATRYHDDAALEQVLTGYFQAQADTFRQQPMGYAVSLHAFLEWAGAGYDIVFSEGADAKNLPEALNIVYSYYIPNKVVMWRPYHEELLNKMEHVVPYMVPQKPMDEQLTFYVCRHRQCEQPTTDAAVLAQQLKR